MVDGLYAFIEDADDRLKLIPYAGPIAASLADSPAVDVLEREACEFLVEQAYQVLALADKLGLK